MSKKTTKKAMRQHGTSDSKKLLGAVLPLPKIELPSTGLGTYRTSGTIIGLLLQLEEEQGVSVLVDTAKQLGYTLKEISDQWNETTCCHCGMGSLHHDNGRCP